MASRTAWIAFIALMSLSYFGLWLGYVRPMAQSQEVHHAR